MIGRELQLRHGKWGPSLVSSPSRRGFTLIEILTATAMVAVLVGSLFASLHVGFKARESALQATDLARRGAIPLDFIQADLLAAVPPTGVLARPFVGEAAANSSSAADKLTFCAAIGDGGDGAGELAQVEYATDLPADGTGAVLVRRLTRNLLAEQEPEPTEEVICRGAASVTFEYFDGETWLVDWDSTTYDNSLPLAVRVTLELDDKAAEGMVFRRTVLLPCASSLSLSGATGGAR